MAVDHCAEAARTDDNADFFSDTGTYLYIAAGVLALGAIGFATGGAAWFVFGSAFATVLGGASSLTASGINVLSERHEEKCAEQQENEETSSADDGITWNGVHGITFIDASYSQNSYVWGFTIPTGNPHVWSEEISIAQSSPIILDLDGDGVEIVGSNVSGISLDIDNDGYLEKLAWAGADDGFLFYDDNGDGVAQLDEIILTNFAPGAETDLEALATFDTNDDGVLDASDNEFSKFKIWNDADQDGVSDAGEVLTLASEDIVSIDVTGTASTDSGDGYTIHNTGEFTYSDTSTRGFVDVSLIAGPGFKETYSDASGNILETEAGAKILEWTSASALTFTIGTSTFNGESDFNDAHGGGGADTITGDSEMNIISGGGGADTLNGGGGDDLIIADDLDLATGSIAGGTGYDTLIINSAVGVTFDLNALGVEIAYGGEGNDTLSYGGTLNGITIFGGSGNDTLTINGGSGLLYGNDGNDSLTGGAGDDILVGGDGDDSLDGKGGDDLLLIDASDNLTNVDGGAGDDFLIYSGTAAVTLNFANLNIEHAFGGDGDDTITGTSGDNIIAGGLGDDDIEGKDGDDLYLYSKGDGKDTILDSSGNDTLSISGDGLSAQDLVFDFVGSRVGCLNSRPYKNGERKRLEKEKFY